MTPFMSAQGKCTIPAANRGYGTLMKRIFVTLPLLAALAGPASAGAKAGIEGRWKNGKMEILIAPCGTQLCGTIVKASPKQQAKAERGSGTELIGARLITGIHPAGPRLYRGRVFLADRNVHARGTIRELSSNQLFVKGCLFGVICKSATWNRVDR